MAIEKEAETGVQSAEVNGSAAAAPVSPEPERLLALVRQQMDQLAQTVDQLTKELAAQRAAVVKLTEERDKCRFLAHAFGGIVFPEEEMIRELENMPPFEELPPVEELLAIVDSS